MEEGPLRGRGGRQERREQKPRQINDPSSPGGGISSRKVGGCLAGGQFAEPSLQPPCVISWQWVTVR